MTDDRIAQMAIALWERGTPLDEWFGDVFAWRDLLAAGFSSNEIAAALPHAVQQARDMAKRKVA